MKTETKARPTESPAAPRKQRRDGLATRQAILQSAEKLFSASGPDGVSIRQITQASNVDLALVNYYFQSKDNLFAETLTMRVDEMNSERLILLEQVELVEGSEKTLVEIFDAFTRPYVGLTPAKARELSNYRRLVALVANSKRWQHLVFKEHYDPVAKAFVEALQKVLPFAAIASLYWSMSFFLGALVNAFAETGRIERLSSGVCDSNDLERVRRNLINFTIGGLLRVAMTSSQR